MAARKKLSFSVESILSRSSTDHKQNLERRHSCAGGPFIHLPSSPPESPFSTVSEPSPSRESSFDDVPSQDHNEEQIGGSTLMSNSNTSMSVSAAAAARKGRMRFSTEQVQMLEQRFQEQHYLLPADRKVLALSLGMSERQVKTWFQNKRAQCKRSRAYTYPAASILHPYTPTSCCNFSFPYAMPPFPPSSPLPSFGSFLPPTTAIDTSKHFIIPTHHHHHQAAIIPSPINCFKQFRTSCQISGTDY